MAKRTDSEKKRLGDMLIEKGLIDRMQLEAALGRQKQWGGRLGFNLVKLGYISETTMLKFLSSQLKLPCADLSKLNISGRVLDLLHRDVAVNYHILPLQVKEEGGKKYLFLAMSEPMNILAIDEVSFLTGCTVKPVIATDSQIAQALEKYYEKRGWINIDPLSETIQVVHPETMEIVHEVPLKEKIAMDQKKTETRPAESPGVTALVNILVKKGVINRYEYLEELETLKKR